METLRQLLRDIDNRSSPAQLDLLGRLWAGCPKMAPQWKPDWPEAPELKTERFKKVIDVVGESIVSCATKGNLPPIPQYQDYNETELLEREHYVEWIKKVVDIQRGRPEAWRKFWVIQQLKTIQALLKDDGNEE